MERRSKRVVLGAALGVLLSAPIAAAAQTLSDADKIAELERQTKQLQRHLKQLQGEIAETRQKAEKVEAAQAAASTPLAIPVALQKPGGAATDTASKTEKAPDSGASASSKDKAPAFLGAYGVSLYGTIDVGYAYTSNGAPVSGADYRGADYSIFNSRFAEQGDLHLDEQRPGAIQAGAEDRGKHRPRAGKLSAGSKRPSTPFPARLPMRARACCAIAASSTPT